MNRLKKIIILIVLMLLCSLFTKVYAIENMIGTIDEKDYSSEFKKWLALPEEERKNYIMPNMFSVDLNINDLDEDMAGASTLLEKYSLADNINIRVRNQEETPFCWTFASSKVFETTYAKLNNKTTYEEYSPRHMAYSTSLTFKDNVINPSGFNMEITEGGNYHQALAYYTSGKGPVLEEDMPFVNTIDKIEISDIENKEVQAQLEDAIFFPTIIKSYGLNGNVSYSDGFGSNYSESEIETFRNKIKLHIMEYGAIGAYTFIPQSATDISYFSMLGSNNYFCNNTS